jgi:hypothetical protein
MNDRLRMDLELKNEIIKTLRAERERDGERAREQAVLMATLTAEWHQRAAALSLLLAEPDPSAARSAAESLASASAELADYTAANAGDLALTLEPVNLRQFLRSFRSRAAIKVRVAANVPERVLPDQARLSRILSYLISEGPDTAVTEGLLLEVTANEADAQAAPLTVRFAVQRPDGAQAARMPVANAPSPAMRLRAALAQALCQLMGASLTPDELRVPLRGAADQAHTGVFRLAMSEANALAEAVDAAVAIDTADAESRPDDDGGAIDFLYLDRQLGSLAQVILTRTAPAFVAQAQRRMTDLHVAHDIEDLERLRAVAHAWRGSALSVGARKLAVLLDAIEKQSAAGRLPGPGPLWQLRGTLDQAVRALEGFIERDGGRHARA